MFDTTVLIYRLLNASSYFAACDRVHISTQHASEIAWNSMKLLEMPLRQYTPSGNEKKVEICSTRCDMRQNMNRPLLSIRL